MPVLHFMQDKLLFVRYYYAIDFWHIMVLTDSAIVNGYLISFVKLLFKAETKHAHEG